MKKTFGIIVVSMMLISAGMSCAEEGVKADNLIDLAGSRVSYEIKTDRGEGLIITADYAKTRPNPEIENMDIAPLNAINEGTKEFKLATKEGIPIELQYVYARGERVGMKIYAEPSNPSSDAEYPQVLSVESNAGYIINFTFIWQGQELKEVRIEPQKNPFAG
jgi:hypothetical protein